MRVPISQREARRLRRRVHQLENFLAGYGTVIATLKPESAPRTAEKVRVAQLLNHPVVVSAYEDGSIVFRGLGQIPTAV